MEGLPVNTLIHLPEARIKTLVKVVVWIAIALIGMTQAWCQRHRLFSDGLAYLDIASYYAKGDWHSALNSYWSPLYSWLIAVFLVVLRPNAYWQVAVLHLVNYCGYLASLASLELLMGDLIRFQGRRIGPNGLSEMTVRTVGYSVFLLATLLLINLGYVSPDLIAMALQFYALHCLLLIQEGSARRRTYILFGVTLGLSYLCRAAFLPMTLLFLFLASVLLVQRRTPLLRPIGIATLAAIVVIAPFVVALSYSKSHFTFGEAGKLNYGWEVDGAPRWVHWQGEPGNIGKPVHPTRKVLENPATFAFASPVPGTYAPWYEPSYWYEGIKPNFNFQAQWKIFVASTKAVLYLLLRSPVVFPVLLLGLLMGLRNWLSFEGLFAYWFLLIPAAGVIFIYMLVYVDPRYIASSLVVIWLCLITSVTVSPMGFRKVVNRAMQELSLVFAIALLASRLESQVRASVGDLLHGREGEWNLNWMLSDGLKKLGLKATDKVAWIGQGIDSEWARIAGVKIVAEVPPMFERDDTLFRRIDWGNRKNVNVFWRGGPAVREKVLQAFREAGATVVVADKIPRGVDNTGWAVVLPENAAHMTNGAGQSDYERRLRFMRIAPASQ